VAILGIDEVGRGPWAGPLVVGACVLTQPIDGLTDSKKLTPKRRTELNKIIKQTATVGLGWITSAELDKIGLPAALRKATRDAVHQIHTPFHEIIIDGTINFLSNTPLSRHVTTLAKADLLIPEVSAASIIAKVARDAYMTELAKKYPAYHFDKHVGYGTAAHRTALLLHGPCPEHRTSFRPIRDIKDHLGNAPAQNSTKTIGNQAETKTAEYLQQQGHQILDRNWRTKTCEIDIISLKNHQIFFTEVKYRKTPSHGDGKSAITPDKLHRMQKATTTYLKYHPKLTQASPVLAIASLTSPNFTLQDFLILS
jgi:ribonuclease HII